MNISKSSLVALVGMGLIWSLAAAADDPQAAEATPPKDAKDSDAKADKRRIKRTRRTRRTFQTSRT